MKFIWEEHPNTEIRTLHQEHRLNTVYATFASDLAKASPEDQEFIRRIKAIDGVTSVGLGGLDDCYSCSIGKGKVYDWPPIMAAVEELFRARFGEPGDGA